MKRYAAWFLAGLIGAAIGTLVTASAYNRTIRAAIPSTLQSMENNQRYRCVLGMAVLTRLERNEPDRAKLLLAREIASYYRHPLGLPESEGRKIVMEQVESLRAKSSALNDELNKKPQ